MSRTQPSNFAWSKGKYLVYFTSSNCGYCSTFASTWDNTVDRLRETSSGVKTLKVNAEQFDIASVSPEVYGYPTVRAYENGKMVGEFDEERTTTKLLNFSNKHFATNARQTGGARRRRRARRSARRNRFHQRGGMAPLSSVGAPTDMPSAVPPTLQSSGPSTPMLPPAPHGGLYHPLAPPAKGGWGSIPVPPTSAGYTHNNLRSANPPPGAIDQYMTSGTNRPGNSHSAKPGVFEFQDGKTHTLKCTNSARGGKRNRRRSRRRATRRRK